MGTDYIMENEDEALRLELKTDASVVDSFARRAGLGPGMRVVDIACGAGLTTSILGAIAGGSGSATGIDISRERVERARALYGGDRTSFETRDFRLPMEGLGPFDFAWVRFALEYHRAEAFDIVRNISEVLAPGGTLCLIDLDYNCLSHYGMSDRLQGALSTAIRQMELMADIDPYAGRKLYSHLYRLGYAGIEVEAGAHHLIYGKLREVDEYNWGRKIEVITSNIDLELPGYSSPREFYDDFMSFFRDPSRFTYTPVIMAWGKKPG
jgi:SAM-dependent methyltransferase